MTELPQETEHSFGPERRKGRERRINGIRREEFRFDPGKADRRRGKDRRTHRSWEDSVLR